MATSHIFTCQRALARHAVPLTLGLSSGLWLVSRRPAMRLDALPSSSSPSRSSGSSSGPELLNRPPPAAEKLDPEVLRQISGGSLSGLVSGLLVSTFSRTLVLLIGVAIVALQIAARYGVDIIQQLRVKERAKSSKILAALRKNTAFKLSFGLTFAMSAFMSF